MSSTIQSQHGTDYSSLGYAKTYVVLPSTIYGVPSNPLVDAGIQRAHSIQIPMMVKASVARGQGGKVGRGLSVWNHISNDDSLSYSSDFALRD